MELSQPSDESKVLIIYTGGTIGMLVGHQGYVPEPYFLTETLHSQHRFHDPLEESLFSHSASVEGFREWSGRATPLGGPTPRGSTASSRASSPTREGSNHSRNVAASTLVVRSSRPIGAPLSLTTTGESSQQSVLRHPSCKKVADNLYEAHLHSLVTPRTTANGSSSKRIRYVILEVCLLSLIISRSPGLTHLIPKWHPLLDSSNMDIAGTVLACPLIALALILASVEQTGYASPLK